MSFLKRNTTKSVKYLNKRQEQKQKNLYREVIKNTLIIDGSMFTDRQIVFPETLSQCNTFTKRKVTNHINDVLNSKKRSDIALMAYVFCKDQLGETYVKKLHEIQIYPKALSSQLRERIKDAIKGLVQESNHRHYCSVGWVVVLDKDIDFYDPDVNESIIQYFESNQCFNRDFVSVNENIRREKYRDNRL